MKEILIAFSLYFHLRTVINVEYFQFLSELSLLHGDVFIKFQPSMVAAASLALARHQLSWEYDTPTWPETMVTSTGYSLDSIKECMLSLQDVWRQAATSPQQAIREKYKSSK